MVEATELAFETIGLALPQQPSRDRRMRVSTYSSVGGPCVLKEGYWGWLTASGGDSGNVEMVSVAIA